MVIRDYCWLAVEALSIPSLQMSIAEFCIKVEMNCSKIELKSKSGTCQNSNRKSNHIHQNFKVTSVSAGIVSCVPIQCTGIYGAFSRYTELKQEMD